MTAKKPGNLIAAGFNIAVCGVIVVGSTIMGFTQSPFAFFVAAIGVIMEVLFVRILIEILKERRTSIEPGDSGPV